MTVGLPDTATAPFDHGEPSRALRWVALIAGVGAILTSVSPWVDTIADRSFSMHMVQHMVLTNVGAVLLAIAWPLVLGRWESTGIVEWLNWLAHLPPALLILISSGAFWFWHIPFFYDVALDNEAIHALEHLIFIGAFVLYWRPLMNDPMAGHRLRTNEGRVFYLTIGMVANGVLAAYITFADHLIYTHYAHSSAGGRTPLQDQQLGGGIMLLFGAITTVIVGILAIREEPAMVRE